MSPLHILGYANSKPASVLVDLASPCSMASAAFLFSNSLNTSLDSMGRHEAALTLSVPSQGGYYTSINFRVRLSATCFVDVVLGADWLVASHATHWGQGVVFWPGTSQIHHKYMDKVPTSFPRGSCQLHLKFPLPVCLWFTDPVIFKDILNVPRVYHVRATSRTPQVSVQCARPGHRDHISSVHSKFPITVFLACFPSL